MNKNILVIICLFATMNLFELKAEEPRSYQVGEYSVYVLTENEGQGNIKILIDAPKAVTDEYAPDGTFPNAVRAIVIKKQDEIWLVDTGFGRNIFTQMESIGISPENVDHVLLTHMHGDHIGGMLREDKPAFQNADVTVSENEQKYWGSEEKMMEIPENRRGNFLSAQNVFRQYGDKVKIQQPYDINSKFTDGIHMLEAYGHTPGHVMYLIQDGENKLLIWGDLTHALAIQMPHPEISVTYDIDPDMARNSRLKVLEYVAKNKIEIAGMHVPYSGVGEIGKSETSNGYIFSAIPGLP